MARFRDLAGMKFGMLTVWKLADAKPALWLCRCACSNHALIKGPSMTSGNVKSCGCLKNNPQRNDLVGQRFCKLTVVSFSHNGGLNNKRPYWNCVCDCGNFHVTSSLSLRLGKTSSCGCLKKERMKAWAKTLAKKGPLNNNWDHTKTPEQRLQRRPQLSEWPKEIYKRDKYTCLSCKKTGIKLHAHHLTPYCQDKSLAQSMSNGATLCFKCHRKFHKLYGQRRCTRRDFFEFINMADPGENMGVLAEIITGHTQPI